MKTKIDDFAKLFNNEAIQIKNDDTEIKDILIVENLIEAIDGVQKFFQEEPKPLGTRKNPLYYPKRLYEEAEKRGIIKNHRFNGYYCEEMKSLYKD